MVGQSKTNFSMGVIWQYLIYISVTLVSAKIAVKYIFAVNL